ncbi:MAG: hypothetical protein ACYSUD_20340 [Planctomycetota bacterium]|jgi:hypothetical protein
MAAKKRRRKGKTKGFLFSLDFLKRKRTRAKQASWVGPTLISFLKVLAVICCLSAVAIGLLYLEEYVKDSARNSGTKFYLELADVPTWVSDELREKVRRVAERSSEDLRSDDDAARSVQRSIEQEVAWLDEVRVRARQDKLRVEARWRKPIALIKSGLEDPRYVDINQVVLDFGPMPNLPMVEIEGLSRVYEIPHPGQPWDCDDLTAAIEILDRLRERDRTLKELRPLLYEIDRIDVTNFSGRDNRTQPHIVLYTEDNVPIVWGAELGRWQHFLESTDEQKLGKLYTYYSHHKTLSVVGVKFINLRDPQDKIPLPIDRY